MNKIIVPTDFSSFADQALLYAVELAKKSGGEVRLLHIMLTPDNTKIEATRGQVNISGYGENEYLLNAVKGSQKNLESLIESLEYERVSYFICAGNVGQNIIEFAEKEQADLIVMGTQGESGYDSLFVGSNAEKVVRLAQCPVLTIRKKPKNVSISKMVLACDLGKDHKKVIDQIKQVQSLFDSELHLVYINTPANFTCTQDLEEKAAAFATEHSLSNHQFHIYCEYVEDDGINQFAKSIDANLVVLISHKRRGFARLLAGSISEGVVGSAQIPVMTFSLH
jgi:nucleotide-binding universal stress UspA family protein